MSKIVSDVLMFKLTLWFYAFHLVGKFIFIDLVRLFFIRKASRQKKKKKKKKGKIIRSKRKKQFLRSCKAISMQFGGLTSKDLFVIFYLMLVHFFGPTLLSTDNESDFF